MNGEDFYAAFKDALDYLGVGFNGKLKVTVTIEDSRLYMTYQDRECSIKLPAYTENEE